MNKVKELSLFITVVIWATLIGAIAYSHIAFMPGYLNHLPTSTRLVTGPDAIHDERFWMMIHPILIVTLLVTLILNWRSAGRKYILLSLGIYFLVLVVTFSYFVPELKAFAQADKAGGAAAEWLARGKNWEWRSWIRGSFMYIGFFSSLLSLLKNRPAK